jgi:hypothetical protein
MRWICFVPRRSEWSWIRWHFPQVDEVPGNGMGERGAARPGARGERPSTVKQQPALVHAEREQCALRVLFPGPGEVLRLGEPESLAEHLPHRAEGEHPAVHGMPPLAAVRRIPRQLLVPEVPLLPGQLGTGWPARNGTASTHRLPGSLWARSLRDSRAGIP